MKKAIFAVIALTASVVAIQPASAGEPWQEELLCGGYSQVVSGGVAYDNSKYALRVGKAEDRSGAERKLTLYKNHSDGSSIIATGQGCAIESGYLLCEVGDVGVALDLQQNPKSYEYGSNRFYTYVAEITVPKLFGFGSKTHLGTCKAAVRIR